MKNRFVWVGALALGVGAVSQVQTKAAHTNSNGTIITNGTIIVTTRSGGDGWYYKQGSSLSTYDMGDSRGPGCSPGDVAMCELLQDNGYSTRLIPDKALCWQGYPWGSATVTDVNGNPNDPTLYYNGYNGPGNTQGPNPNELLSAMLVVVSGSGSSSDVAYPNTNGVPIICGEHSVLGSGDAGVPSNTWIRRFLTTRTCISARNGWRFSHLTQSEEFLTLG